MKIGVQISSIGARSMKVPSSSSRILTSSRNTYLFSEMPTPALAAHPKVIATPHTAGLTLPAIEHQSLETVAQAAEILKGRAPKGAVNAERWTRKELLIS